MTEQRIDYTKYRVGTVVRRWKYRKPDGTEGVGQTKIARCPKCGRKGEKMANAVPKTGVTVSVGGFAMFHVDDQCCVLTPEGEKLAAERKAKADGR
jgi:hypothetical protein